VTFIENGYENVKNIMHLNENNLNTLKITPAGYKKLILKESKELKKVYETH
jgi:hypothetical protein